MKKFIFSILVAISIVFIPTAAMSESLTFYDTPMNNSWKVFGVIKDDGRAFCQNVRKYEDGSWLTVNYDLDDGEMWIGYTDTDWNINKKNFEKSFSIPVKWIKKFPNSKKPDMTLSDKLVIYVNTSNTIFIKNLNKEVFIKLWGASSYLVLYMPWDIPPRGFDLTGTSEAFNRMAGCLETYGKLKKLADPDKINGIPF